MKVLIVEDEDNLRSIVAKFLLKNGFAVDETDNGKTAIEMSSINEYDCILLDLNLPEVDGIEVASRLRNDGINFPIIMLTARSQLYDKIKGFNVGTDDYITKPFELSELLVRIRAVVKRNSINKDNVLKLGKFILYPDKNYIQFNDTHISLSNKETSILEYMIRNKGKIISTEELLEHVWDREVDLFTDTVKTHIKSIRKKIDPSKRILRTIRGKGYLIE